MPHFIHHIELQSCMASQHANLHVFKVPVQSCPWAAGLISLLGNLHPQLWCTGPAATARCAGWSHTRYGLAESRRDVAAVQCTPPERGHGGERRYVSNLNGTCMIKVKCQLTQKYLHHGCLLRKNKRNKDYGELLWVVYHKYKAEVEHADGCGMLMCCALCFWQSL